MSGGPSSAAVSAGIRTEEDEPPPRRRTGALVVCAVLALALFLVRSWRIDYPYSIDFQTYWLAGRRVATGQAPALYAPGGGARDGTPQVLAANEFKNLPIIAVAFAPLGALDYATAKRVFWWIDLAAMLASAVLLGGAVLPARCFGAAPARVATAIAFLCVFAPAQIALRHGQTTPLVLLALTGFLAAARSGRRAAAGGWLAAATAVKIPVLALVLREGLRRRWITAGVWLLSTGALLIASLVLFGPGLHRGYLHGLSEHAGTVMSGHNNQSMAAFLNRVAGPTDVYDWTPRPMTGAVRAVSLLLVLALIALASKAILVRPRTVPAGAEAFEFAAFLALGLVSLPVAWDHYFLLLAPGLLLVAAALWAKGWLSRPAPAVALAAAVLALALPTPQRILDWCERTGSGGGLLGAILLSHYFLGALLVLGLSVWALGAGTFPAAAAGRRR